MIVALIWYLMTTVECKHLQSHDTCRLVFPLQAWLYGNIKFVELICFPFFLLISFFFFFSVLQKCDVLWKIQVQQQELLWISLFNKDVLVSCLLKSTTRLRFTGFIYTEFVSINSVRFYGSD